MGRLPFPPDVELTGPDRVVLSNLRKDYELHGTASEAKALDAAEDSDDSATKHSEFVAPSPEGNICLCPCRDGVIWCAEYVY
jgi:hypothetical protein